MSLDEVVTKVRRGTPGRCKSGGYPVTYFVRQPKGVIWMLTMYPKSVTDSLPGHVLKQIRQEIEND